MAELDTTWDELRSKLTRYVRSKVDVDVSEDLVHDILLRVLQNEEALSNADNPLAWMYSIAKNRITDHYRKQSMINTKNEIVDSESMPDSVDHDFAKCLRPLSDRLEPKYKEALLLADFNEIKQSVAAERIGISISGMKSRVQRGRAKLKEELLACCAVEKDRFGNVIDYKRKDRSNKDQCC
ncbi:MAG: sigma-70 family RNA polymerase sigma factor [Gammaproteobacteria bacterium]|nr:MAG: sigma-70 family RNA polymerase sigma factor [Gammaproteobacteria bacterium]